MVRIWSLSKSLVSKRKTYTKWLLKIVTLGFGTIFGQVSFIQSSKLFHKKPQTSLIIIYGIGDFWRSDHWSSVLLYVPIFEYDLLCKLFWNQLLFTEKHIFWKGGQFQPSAFWTFLAESSNRSSTINALIMIFCILEAGGYFWGCCLRYSSRFRRGKYLMVSKGKWRGHAAFTM